MQTQSGDSSTSELVAQLTTQMTELVREEIQLARTELLQKAREAALGAGLIAAGGLLAYTALFAVIDALISLLDAILPRWLAAALVGMLVAGAGGMLAARGVAALRSVDLMPRQTIASVKEDARWMKDQTK